MKVLLDGILRNAGSKIPGMAGKQQAVPQELGTVGEILVYRTNRALENNPRGFTVRQDHIAGEIIPVNSGKAVRVDFYDSKEDYFEDLRFNPITGEIKGDSYPPMGAFCKERLERAMQFMLNAFFDKAKGRKSAQNIEIKSISLGSDGHLKLSKTG